MDSRISHGLVLPTCDYQCQKTKLCYDECKSFSDFIWKDSSSDCGAILRGIVNEQRSGAEILINSLTFSSRNSSAFSSSFFQLVEGLFNNCTTDIVEDEAVASCTTSTSLKYSATFIDSQTNGN
jgi:hypothetical protein